MRRYKLTAFQLFPHTTPEEREEYYEADEKGEFLPQFRYDRLDGRNHCRKINRAKLESSNSDPPGAEAETKITWFLSQTF